MVRWELATVVVGLASCFAPDVTVCSDGDICPATLVCDVAHDTCVPGGQIDACSALAQGDACQFQALNGFCDQGVCHAAICGDGVVVTSEACDDGNGDDGDGCSADCQSTETCGNGVVDTSLGEDCDCGTDAAALPSGCLLPNSDAPEASCRSNCSLQCGDGEVDPLEDCDGYDPLTACVDFGFDRGAMECESTCTLNFSGCRHIGFTREFLPATVDIVTDVWQVDGEVFAVGIEGGTVSEGTLAHFDGLTWSAEKVPQWLNAVWGPSASEVYAVGDGGSIYRFDGSQWTQEDPALPAGRNKINAVWGDDNNVLIAVSALQGNKAGGVYARQPDGTWVLDWDDAWALLHVFALGGNADTGFVLGGRYIDTLSAVPLAARRTGPGQWTPIGGPLASTPSALFSVDGEDFLGDGAGALRHYDAETDSWPILRQLGGTVSGIGGTAADNLYIATSDFFTGKIFHYDGRAMAVVDEGTGRKLAGGKQVVVSFFDHVGRWFGSGYGPSTRLITSTYLVDIADMWIYDRTYAVAVGGGFVGTWSGTTATSEYLVPTILRTVWGRSPQEVYAAGGVPGYPDLLSTIFKFDGISWQELDPQPPFPPGSIATLHGDANRLIAGGTDGWLGELSQGTWQDRSLPVTDTIDDAWTGNGEIFAVAAGDLWHWKNSVWTRDLTSGKMRSLWGSSATNVVAVGDDGEIWRFDGTQWTPMLSPTVTDLAKVRGAAASDIFAVARGNEVIHFDGYRWAPVTGPDAATWTLAVSATDVLVGGSFGFARRLIRTEAWAAP